MLMLGVRNQGYNTGARPDASRKGLAVANPRGDLCGYVAHWDLPQLRQNQSAVRGAWEAIAARMRALLPGAFGRLSRHLEAARVRDRLYCQDAKQLMSGDGIVNNVGVSAAYQSPAHRDANDVGWTVALAVKCSH